MTGPVDELAARRAAKASRTAAPAGPSSALHDDLTRVDYLLVRLLGEMDGELLVSADLVRETVREASRIVVDCWHATRQPEGGAR